MPNDCLVRLMFADLDLPLPLSPSPTLLTSFLAPNVSLSLCLRLPPVHLARRPPFPTSHSAVPSSTATCPKFEISLCTNLDCSVSSSVLGTQSQTSSPVLMTSVSCRFCVYLLSSPFKIICVEPEPLACEVCKVDDTVCEVHDILDYALRKSRPASCSCRASR